MRVTNNFVFFWSGYLSQWFKSPFEEEGVKFNTCEQYMMYWKAKYFKDDDIAQLILEAKTPKEQKLLGRQIKNFDSDEWNKVCKLIVYNGNYLKFSPSFKYYRKFLDTAPKELVEASPYDKIWGVGLKYDNDLILDKSNWNGLNWLGEVLTGLRTDIKNGKAPINYIENIKKYT